ncbi:hypothetical protein GCM10023189_59660 [Nibrella saemangeumensis]|uniref:Uncharacterized protein n=1 Tax=Nibrella saemangeumensis TaxID=1084526 RepID=A0ABP8NTI8_9BACT
MKRFFTINESLVDLATKAKEGEVIIIHQREIEEDDTDKVHQFFWLHKMWSNRLEPLLKHVQDYFRQQGVTFRYVVRKAEHAQANG